MRTDRKVVIWRQQPAPLGDDTVPVVIRIRSKREVELVFQTDKPLHGIRRRRIRANLPIPIHSHEAKRGINGFIHDREVEAILLSNSWPIVDACPAKGVDTKPDLRLVDERSYPRRCRDLRRRCSKSRACAWWRLEELSRGRLSSHHRAPIAKTRWLSIRSRKLRSTRPALLVVDRI